MRRTGPERDTSFWLEVESDADGDPGVVLAIGRAVVQIRTNVFSLDQANADVRNEIVINAAAERHREGVLAIADSTAIAVIGVGREMRTAEQHLSKRVKMADWYANLRSEHIGIDTAVEAIRVRMVAGEIADDRHHRDHSKGDRTCAAVKVRALALIVEVQIRITPENVNRLG